MSIGYKLIDTNYEPKIYVTPLANYKMRYYIDNSDKEIGWLGYVENLGNNTYVITDVFLVKQQVHSATTEMSPEGLAEIATTLISQGEEGIKKYNSIKMWGHSHVNMAPTPSGQDDTQMKDFASNDYYIRLIGNKSGVWNVSLWDFAHNLMYEGLELSYWFDVDVNDDDLAKEIKDNVTEKVYTTPTLKGFPYQNKRQEKAYFGDYYDDYYEDAYGGYYYGKEKTSQEKTQETQEIEDIVPYYFTGSPSDADLRNIVTYYSGSYNDLLYLCCGDEASVRTMVAEDWDCTLTDKEIKKVQEYACKELNDRYKGGDV